jgi:hypothetical protein
MNLETIFDDLESHLEADRTIDTSHAVSTDQARRLRVELTDSSIHHLVAPILGCDFLAGLDEYSANWFCVNFSCLSEIRFDVSDDLELPTLRIQEITFEKFLKAMKLPIAVQIKTRGSAVKALAVLAIKDSLMFARGPSGSTIAHSLQAVEFIQIIEYSDRNDLKEWSNR